MRLPRITTRRLMVLVAVAAIFAFGAVMVRKAREYRHAAARHAIKARIIELEAGPATISKDRERAAYHSRMKGKYDRAASRPWLPVPPDPPPPK